MKTLIIIAAIILTAGSMGAEEADIGSSTLGNITEVCKECSIEFPGLQFRIENPEFPRKQWEYKVYWVDGRYKKRQLNVLGKEGWEAYAATYMMGAGVTIYFKREVLPRRQNYCCDYY